MKNPFRKKKTIQEYIDEARAKYEKEHGPRSGDELIERERRQRLANECPYFVEPYPNNTEDYYEARTAPIARMMPPSWEANEEIETGVPLVIRNSFEGGW